jgi:hypothetical protein
VGRLPTEIQSAERLILLQRRAWVRRSAGDFWGAIEDLDSLISHSAEAKDARSEVNGLLDLSRFCLYVDRQRCLNLAEQAFVKVQDIDDTVLKALVRGNIANLNLMLRGWRDEDANVCFESLTTTTNDDANLRTSLRRCSMEVVLDYLTSNYPSLFVLANKGKQLCQTIGDEYYFILFNTLQAFAHLHLGEWGKLRACVSEALKMTERNANHQGTALCRLMIGWLNAEAFDFEATIRSCDEARYAEVDANPLNFFLRRSLLAKACVGLRRYPAAFAQLREIEHQIDAVGVAMDTVIRPFFHHIFCQYWIEMGDLARAREQACCFMSLPHHLRSVPIWRYPIGY